MVIAWLSLLSAPFGVARLPVAGENMYVGEVVRANDRELTITLESQIEADGRELFFGSMPEKQLTISRQVRIHPALDESAWLRLADLPEGVSIALYQRGAAPIHEIRADLPVTPKHSTVPPLDPAAVNKVSQVPVTVPMVFPVLGKFGLSDTYLAPRSGGRQHLGQDIMAPKMTPLLACFDGEIYAWQRGTHFMLTVTGAGGWVASYMHINNDTPGTDDGKADPRFAYAPGIRSGAKVRAGQLIGFVGDSGNAESTGSHLHFELRNSQTDMVYNAYPSLAAAERVAAPTDALRYPDWTPAEGEVRVDGVVHGYDASRDVVVLDLTRRVEPGRVLPLVVAPKLVYVKAAGLGGASAWPVGSSVSVMAEPLTANSFRGIEMLASG